jgi:hypothetical protein
MTLKTVLACRALGVAALSAQAQSADETDIGAAISLELNAVKSTENACTLSFMVINGHPSPIDQLVFETVLFDANGQVDRLTLFDFGALPPARPRVRQFSVPGVACDGLGMILINGASTCTSADLPATACETGLTVTSRTDIEVQG